MPAYKSLIFGLFSLIFLSGLRATEAETTKDDRRQAWKMRLRESYASVQAARVSGRVVDLDGNPVAEAEVKISWSRATFLIGMPESPTETWIKSDVRGEWFFPLDKPDCIYVMDAAKDGYEFVHSKYPCQDLVGLSRRTKGAPVVVRMRKKGEATFLIRREGPRAIRAHSPHSQTNGLDLMEERPDRLRAESYADIQLAINWLPNSNRWEVVFSAPNGADGLLVGTNLLYEAPQDGYQKNVAVSDPPWPQHVYLRSRKQPIYSRIDLEYYPWKGSDTNQVLGICYKAWVNPFGERNLEYDQRASQSRRTERELTQEAKTAIEKGRRYQKPDIEQRIKATNERLEKEKAAKAQARP